MDIRTFMFVQSTLFIIAGLLLTLPGNYYEYITQAKISGNSVNDIILGEDINEKTTHNLFALFGFIILACGIFELILLGSMFLASPNKKILLTQETISHI